MKLIVNMIQGFCMALADSVPGVSGGTIAFILGFYDEFIFSLDHLVAGTKEERIRAIRFLTKLGAGWIIGFCASVLVLGSIFDSHIYELCSLFLGFSVFAVPLILAEEKKSFAGNYKNIIFNNIELDQVLEDQSLYWNDDKEIVDTFVLKTIKRFDEKNGAKQELLPEFKDEEDQDFARRLFRRTILNADYYRHLISENTKNWDLDRVAFMDVVIMQIALAEILSFPNIPVSVSLNEYVEIAKLYSTPKSGGFINGTLDGIVNSLKKENKLTKN
jgi:transcription antitermination factor NusB